MSDEPGSDPPEESGGRPVRVHLTGGRMSFHESAYTATIGTDDPDELYIPVRPVGEDDESSVIHVLYQTKEVEFLDLLDGIQTVSKAENASSSKAMRLLKKVAFFEKNPVEGLVQFGMESNKTDRKIKDLFDNLAKDCIIIEAGATPPSLWLGILMLAGGLGIGFFMLGSRRGNEWGR